VQARQGVFLWGPVQEYLECETLVEILLLVLFYYKVRGRDYFMNEKELADRLMKFKKKVMLIVTEKNMYSIMNNTKWKELQNAIKDLPFPPPYQMRYITDDSETIDFNEDVRYLGDWTDEPMFPFFHIEWIKVRPRYLKHRGNLIKDELIDETEKFVEILKKYSIPYEEENGVYVIYGYKKP